MAMIVWVGENDHQFEIDISPKPADRSSWNFTRRWKTPPKIYLQKPVLLNCLQTKLEVIKVKTCPYMVKSWISYWRFELLSYMSKSLIHCLSEHLPVEITRASLKGRAVMGDWFRLYIWIKYLIWGSKNTWQCTGRRYFLLVHGLIVPNISFLALICVLCTHASTRHQSKMRFRRCEFGSEGDYRNSFFLLQIVDKYA